MRVAVVSMTQCVITSDSRVFREACSLQEAGHEVMVIGILKRGVTDIPTRDEYKGVKIRRIIMPPHKEKPRSRFWFLRILTLLFSVMRDRIPLKIRNSLNYVLAIFYLPLPTLIKEYGATAAFSSEAYQQIQRFKASVIHAHDLPMMPLAYVCKRKLGCKIVYDNHELWLDRNNSSRLRWVSRTIEFVIERILIHKADAVLVVGDSIAEVMKQRYGVSITTLHNYPIPKNGTPSLRQHLGITDSQKILLYLGMIDPYRGVEQSIGVLKYLPSYSLVLMGYFLDQGYKKTVLEMARMHDVGDRVHFMSAVPFDQVTSWASSADVGITLIDAKWRSYKLAFPNKLLESIAAGLPVVVNRSCTDMVEFVQKHDIGVAVDIKDTAAIATGVAEVGKYPRFALNAVALAKSIDWNEEVKKLLRIYEGFKQ